MAIIWSPSVPSHSFAVVGTVWSSFNEQIDHWFIQSTEPVFTWMCLIQLSNLFAFCIKLLRWMMRTPQHWGKKQIAKRCTFAACIDRRAFDVKSSGLMIFLLLLHLSARFCINITEKISHTMKFSQWMPAMLDGSEKGISDSTRTRWNEIVQKQSKTKQFSNERKIFKGISSIVRKVKALYLAEIISLSLFQIKLLWHRPTKKGNQAKVHTSFE